MSTADRAGFENAISEYRNRLSNIKADELQAYAKRVAESDKPLEELKSVVGEITSPLALDFLKEGIMHHMGVASAQIKKGGAAFRKDLEKQFNDRLTQLKGKAQGILDEQRGRLQAALDEAKGRAQGTLDQARGNATEAFANARDQANALNPTNTNLNATNDEQGDTAQQRVPEDEDEEPTGFEDEDEDEEPTGFEDEDEDEDEEPTGFGDEPQGDPMNAPARTQPEETDNIDAAESQEDLISSANRIQARYNNLDGAAQRRSDEAYEADPDHTPAGQGSGPNGVRTLDETKTNIGVREETIEKEEQNPDTTFKDPNQQIEANADISDPAGGARVRAVRNPDTFEREAEPEPQPQPPARPAPPQQEEVGDTEQAFRDHVDDRVQQLRNKLDDDPELSLKIAGDDEGTSIGTGLAKGQHTAYAERTGGEDVGDKVQQYISDKMDDLKADYPDRVSFGQVGGDIPENEIHVWGANAQNVNLPAGTAIDGEGQAAAIGTAGENEFGIVSTPLKGLPSGQQGAVAQRVAQIEQQGDVLRPTQQLPTGRGAQPPAEEDEIRPAPREPTAGTQDERPAGTGEEDEVVEGFGDDAEAAAETGTKAATKLGTALGEGAGEGLGEDAAIAATTGAETGGLGFLVAGVLGIAGTLASIFAPHHEPKAPTSVGPVAAPTQTVGLR